MLDYLPELLKGLHPSLTLTVASIIVALILSLIFTIILTLKTPGLVWIVRGYITLFTGTPLLVQIFLIYYGPGQFPTLQEYPALWHLLCEQVDHLFHLFNGIHLALMCGKGCYANPLLPLGTIANDVCNGGKEAAIVVGEDRGKLWGDGIAQLGQHIGISFKRCGYGL